MKMKLEEGDFFKTTEEPHPEYGPLFAEGGPWEVLGEDEKFIEAWPIREADVEGELIIAKENVKDHIQQGRIIPIDGEDIEDWRKYEYSIVPMSFKNRSISIYVPREWKEEMPDDLDEAREWIQDALETKLRGPHAPYQGDIKEFTKEAIREKLERNESV